MDEKDRENLPSTACWKQITDMAAWWRLPVNEFLSGVFAWFAKQQPSMQAVVLGKFSESEYRSFTEQGDTENPSWQVVKDCDIPAPREDVRLFAGLEWPEIKKAIEWGRAVSLCVNAQDVGLLIEAIQNRLGHELVIRVPDPGLVCIFDPRKYEQRLIDEEDQADADNDNNEG